LFRYDISTPDFESKLLIDVFPNVSPAMHPDECDRIERYLRDRNEMVQCGVRRCPQWFQEELMILDPFLRCWWDAWKEEWVIDRYQSEGTVEGLLRLAETAPADDKAALRKSATGLLEKGRYYLTVMHFKPEGEFQLNRALIEYLKSCDMQAYSSPAEYIAKKRREADAIAASNERAGNDAVLAGIEKVKDPTNFIAACNAMATGDEIHAHGEDAKFMEGIAEARKKAPPIQMPKAIQRKRRKRL
jgi:hypothetical protein